MLECLPFRPLRRWIAKQQGTVTVMESDSSHISVYKSTGPRGSKSRDSLMEPKVASEKQRQKQQQAFAQDMQSEYMEYLKLKEPHLKGKERTKSASPPPRLKGGGRNQALSPQSAGRKQMLVRDGCT